LSLTTDIRPGAMSWNLTTIRTIHGSPVTDEVLLDCEHCYADNTSYARTDVIEQTCISTIDASCLNFRFLHDSPPMAPNSGYDAFLLQPNGTDISNVSVKVIAIGKGNSVAQDVTFGADDPQCDMTPSSSSSGCSQQGSEDEFLLHLLFDQYPHETRWEIAIDSVPFKQSPQYQRSVATDSHLVQECLPQNTCFNFTIYDSEGDGMCCDRGYGEYVGFYQGKEIFRGGQFQHWQSHLFGSCHQRD